LGARLELTSTQVQPFIAAVYAAVIYAGGFSLSLTFSRQG